MLNELISAWMFYSYYIPMLFWSAIVIPAVPLDTKTKRVVV